MFLDQTRWPPTTHIFSPYSETFAQVRQQYRDFYHRDKTGERDIVDLDEQFPIRFVFVFDTELGKELLTWMTSFLSHLSLYLYLSYTLSTWMTSFLSTFNAFPLLVCLRNCFANYLLHSNESIITRIFSFSKFDSPNFSATSWKMLLLGCLSCIVLRRRKKLRIKTQSERRWWLWRWRWWRAKKIFGHWWPRYLTSLEATGWMSAVGAALRSRITHWWTFSQIYHCSDCLEQCKPVHTSHDISWSMD